MGTNYYIHGEGVCPECEGTGKVNVHLGKSSYGWRFAFQWNGGEYYKDVPQMKAWLKGKKIRDEYGKRMGQKAFWEMVEAKQSGAHSDSTEYGARDLVINGYEFIDSEFS